MRVLISGASVAGPVLAYWLTRYGFAVTVVERAPALRKAGGHAVDLFRPAMDIVDRMGLIEPVQACGTGTERLTLRPENSDRLHELEVGRLMRVVSDRHVEIMRDDLGEIFYEATRHDAEYVFGDSISAVAEDPGGVDVAFERGAPRRFDLVIGADGLHSNVRRLVFGPESRFSTWIGAYLAVMSIPNYLGLRDRMDGVTGVNRMAAVYGGARMDDARAIFLFRPAAELDYHHRDVDRQKELLRREFAGLGWEVPRLLGEELDRASAFYFDSITQLRMDTWSRGRVSLVGDAGYCPGPAVGGSTSLAVVGAYVLAGELAEARGDHTRAFPAYEREIGDYVRRSRAFAVGAAKRLIPATRLGLWSLVQGVRLVNHVPTPVARALAGLGGGGMRLHDEVALKDYPRGPVMETGAAR
ncbi:FAD-dependent monooxygenase [Planomonospora venezuelensis]|uniref:2-polyprenyl-6-methoxyphenol hydroxylase-like FAD-dependent oxidoreductase n=1 Tax=Planomonospora venezuelensis TaxID=1999 RepID=A0A841D5F9_PLAVE|nr:FAD-dependent monooxygenase [Planomonospora venezuelensis]MBB5963588.1 2-polyprenyl-6-methoxyphenol hydroxylase-like FAD-dependent oxidoreductase [Planomonospora venezuelensis]GIN01376.1 FAD-dependent oxidoreductase [Planomonospora venezuelensis]